MYSCVSAKLSCVVLILLFERFSELNAQPTSETLQNCINIRAVPQSQLNDALMMLSEQVAKLRSIVNTMAVEMISQQAEVQTISEILKIQEEQLGYIIQAVTIPLNSLFDSNSINILNYLESSAFNVTPFLKFAIDKPKRQLTLILAKMENCIQIARFNITVTTNTDEGVIKARTCMRQLLVDINQTPSLEPTCAYCLLRTTAYNTISDQIAYMTSKLKALAEFHHFDDHNAQCASIAVERTNSTITQGSVRLVGGVSVGRLEIYYNGTWGTVCDDGFDNTTASVACHSMGYSNGRIFSIGHFLEGVGRISLDDVMCNGTETSISSCQHRPWGQHNCGHSEDQTIACIC